MTTTTKQAKTTRTTKIVLTPELSAALRHAYFCCHEIGSRNQSDYEIESMQAEEQIRTALRAAGADLEGTVAQRTWLCDLALSASYFADNQFGTRAMRRSID